MAIWPKRFLWKFLRVFTMVPTLYVNQRNPCMVSNKLSVNGSPISLKNSSTKVLFSLRTILSFHQEVFTFVYYGRRVRWWYYTYSNDIDGINGLKSHLHFVFSIKDLGPLNFFLGIEVTYNLDGIILLLPLFLLTLNYTPPKPTFFLTLPTTVVLTAKSTSLLIHVPISPILSKLWANTCSHPHKNTFQPSPTP